MNLSVAFAVAARGAIWGEKRVLISLQVGRPLAVDVEFGRWVCYRWQIGEWLSMTEAGREGGCGAGRCLQCGRVK